MRVADVVQAWGGFLVGRRPTLSIEVTRECPLRCPGCYAYEDAHLGNGINLRQLSDFRGPELVRRILETVDRYQPQHLSLVGGDPLVRYREMEEVVPQILQRGIFVQVVTSAFREIPKSWAKVPRLMVSVSIDGLQPEHDVRRTPATYARILKNIKGHEITIHCTITGQMMRREGYLEQFLQYWTPREEIRKIWMSTFTPQRGAVSEEILTIEERDRAVDELLRLRQAYPKLDMREGAIREFRQPPQSPKECIFAQTTYTLSADFQTRIEPCQFGGDPDCSRCGCMASMALAAIGNYRLGGFIPLSSIMRASVRVGKVVSKLRQEPMTPPANPFPVLPSRPSGD